MSNTIIQLRHSYVTGNVPSSLANGEIAINTYDGKLFYRGGASNTIQTIERYEGPAGLDTEIQFNDSGVLGSDSDLSFNKTTDVLSAKNIVVSGNSYFGNANLHEGITQLSVTNDGASAYLFDQYIGSNPSLYVGAGETLSFNLNVSGHPFVIRESSGGANTSAGLTHISTTGVVSTGADAQGKVSGVLFWKVPFSLVGSTYVYQCTIHGGMVGNIVIQQPASFVAANTTLAFNTANAAFLAANAATATDTTQNNSITAAFTAANSAGVYANGAFAAANAATATDTTQNNSITAAFTAANSAGAYANASFDRANNSLNANTGGTITANVTISANLTASNVATQTYIQFGDGTKQYSANGGGIGTTINVYNANTQVFTGTANGTGTTFDLGFVPASQNNIIVSSNGVVQYDYTLSNSTLIFNFTPPSGALIRVQTFGTSQANSLSGVFANGNLIIYDGNTLVSLANTNTAGTYGNSTHVPVITTDEYGRVLSVTNTSISGLGASDQYARDTANAAFGAANNEAGVNATQNTNITFAWNHANAAFDAANTGGGGGSTSSFGTFVANGGAIIATTSNTEVTFVGEAGISVTSNTITKKLTFSAPAGYTFTTADYGFVYEDTNVIYDYGTL